MNENIDSSNSKIIIQSVSQSVSQLVGLIDVDGHNGFPNLALMKYSAWHKAQGDSVEWVRPLIQKHYDIVYMSKVFSFTPGYEYFLDADKIVRGGTGYCIDLDDSGKEVYHKEYDHVLPDAVEHIYPDYSIYGITDKAYGYMTRGCPRGCDFCIVGKKEGCKAYTVAPLSEFWHGQKNIVLLDPNPIAVSDWKDNLQQLIDSNALVDFTQGVDIRLMTPEKAEYIRQIKIKTIHFAWDKYQDKEMIVPKFKAFKEVTGWGRQKCIVYVLTNYNTTLEQDLERIYTLRDLGYSPDVRIYEKYNLPKFHILTKLQRYVNSPRIFNTIKRFEDYERLSDEQREYVKNLNI